MIIDFHTHTFPDSIAEKTIAYLASVGNTTPRREGTLSSLKESMKKGGIDYSVILPVATAPKQVSSINRLAYELNGKDGIIYAGAIHPDCENIDEILDEIKAHNLFGIKIHPDYQGVYFNDDRYIRIMKAASERGLITVTHAGRDIGFPNDIHCTPDFVLEVLEKLEGLIENKLVLAHLGACDQPDEVMQKLIGKPVYFDTAFILDRYPEETKQIISAHGADKILFATDSPWADQKEFVTLLKGYGLSADELDKIFSGNAKRVLKNCLAL